MSGLLRTKQLLNKRNITTYWHSYVGYPLEWDVRLHNWPSNNRVKEALIKNFFLNEADLILSHPDYMDVIKTVQAADMTYSEVAERMWFSWDDGDWSRMLPPKYIEKYALPENMHGVKKPADIKFALVGRSGGHLVVESFLGIGLCTRGSYANDGLDRLCTMNDPENEWWWNLLCAFIEEWDDRLTPDSLVSEIEYQLADMVNQMLVGEVAYV